MECATQDKYSQYHAQKTTYILQIALMKIMKWEKKARPEKLRVSQQLVQFQPKWL